VATVKVAGSADNAGAGPPMTSAASIAAAA